MLWMPASVKPKEDFGAPIPRRARTGDLPLGVLRALEDGVVVVEMQTGRPDVSH